ncbi:MAG TPA: glutamate racemase, partial [Thauera sp.]|nr:glutamate racemase [Thauera sp.]
MSKPEAARPIGVFDSGVGGLTVVRALMERLPLESIVYFGDTARVPYGVKSVATIEHFTAQITEFLLQREVKMLIIACNTMAAVAAEVVHRLAGSVPVLDVIEAGARAAVASSTGRRIGVIGTPTTINSNA